MPFDAIYGPTAQDSQCQQIARSHIAGKNSKHSYHLYIMALSARQAVRSSRRMRGSSQNKFRAGGIRGLMCWCILGNNVRLASEGLDDF